MAATVLNIQRFSTHDGPGIRTTVFFKGCSNACEWCHNPESLRFGPELQVYPDRCIGCGYCLEACTVGAHQNLNGEKVYYRDRCVRCGKCAERCYAQALVMAGEQMSVEQIVNEVMKDEIYYGAAGEKPDGLTDDEWRGGVTLSGGDPVLVGSTLVELLQVFRSKGIHTAIQTAGNYPTRLLEPLVPLIDLFMYDIKVWDSALHKKYVGVVPDQIRTNFEYLSDQKVRMVVRTPVVGGVNDSEDEIGSIARYIGGRQNVLYYELLPYHVLGGSKLASLGLEPGTSFTTPTSQRMSELASVANPYIKTLC